MPSRIDWLPGQCEFINLPVKGLRDEVMYNGLDNMFCHSPESWMQMWMQMWVEDVFGEDRDGNDRVKVETELISAARTNLNLVDYSDEDVWFLKWSVTRF